MKKARCYNCNARKPLKRFDIFTFFGGPKNEKIVSIQHYCEKCRHGTSDKNKKEE